MQGYLQFFLYKICFLFWLLEVRSALRIERRFSFENGVPTEYFCVTLIVIEEKKKKFIFVFCPYLLIKIIGARFFISEVT